MDISLIQKEQEIVDEVMVSVMRAPKTFTREDIVEINCMRRYCGSKSIAATNFALLVHV